jgi:hypothetical protein
MDTTAELRKLLCESWCAELDIERSGNGLRVSLPLDEADGDAVTVWLSALPGGWRVSDQGTTLMRLSYQHDIDRLMEGAREALFERILGEHQINLEDGRLLMTVAEGELAAGLLRYGQAIQRVGDLRFWTRARVASTFYDDLGDRLRAIAGAEKVHRDFAVPGAPAASDYPIDFFIEGGPEPLYVFGVPNRDKARLATIVLQYLQQHVRAFNSLIVFQNVADISARDMRRLMNAANDMVDSIDSVDALERKVKHRIAA